MKIEHVIGCDSCGKPALLVGDETPEQVPACFWCLAERRPGAAGLFLDEVRTAERERVLKLIEDAVEPMRRSPVARSEVLALIARIRKGEP